MSPARFERCLAPVTACPFFPMMKKIRALEGARDRMIKAAVVLRTAYYNQGFEAFARELDKVISTAHIEETPDEDTLPDPH